MNINNVDNLLLNMQGGLLPEYLTLKECGWLQDEFGDNWFEVLGYKEPEYKRPQKEDKMFTLKQLEKEVRRLASENSDYIYRPVYKGYYSYVYGQDSKGCIFGQAITNLFPDFDFSKDEGNTIRVLLYRIGIIDDVMRPEARWFSNVQFEQDGGLMWSECIKVADKREKIRLSCTN